MKPPLTWHCSKCGKQLVVTELVHQTYYLTLSACCHEVTHNGELKECPSMRCVDHVKTG